MFNLNVTCLKCLTSVFASIKPLLGRRISNHGLGTTVYRPLAKGHHVTLPALQKNFVNIFFVFAWEFCIEKWQGFWVNFSWSPSPTKRSTKSPRKIRGKFGAKFGAKFGTKIRKIRNFRSAAFRTQKDGLEDYARKTWQNNIQRRW